MKLLRILSALTLASLAFAGVSRASDEKCDKPAKKCDCKDDKDGKKCGVDKDCCCSGEKATHAEKK